MCISGISEVEKTEIRERIISKFDEPVPQVSLFAIFHVIVGFDLQLTTVSLPDSDATCRPHFQDRALGLSSRVGRADPDVGAQHPDTDTTRAAAVPPHPPPRRQGSGFKTPHHRPKNISRGSHSMVLFVFAVTLQCVKFQLTNQLFGFLRQLEASHWDAFLHNIETSDSVSALVHLEHDLLCLKGTSAHFQDCRSCIFATS